MILFSFFAKNESAAATRTWRNVFPRVIAATRTSSECLSPEEMTHLTDFEGPSFAVKIRDGRTVDVAPTAMCGSGGCPYVRYKKMAPCYQLEGVVRSHDE